MITRQIRRLICAGGIAAVLTVAALPAAADEPTHVRQTFSGAVTDQGQACGFPLSWEFTGEALVTRFFDDGVLVRIHAQVRESGTVTNLATGEVVELPGTAFLERVLRIDGGSIIIVEDNGLSVRVTGPEDFLLDVGRFVVQISPAELLQSSGMHPIREINPFSVSDPALLGAFCDLFA